MSKFCGSLIVVLFGAALGQRTSRPLHNEIDRRCPPPPSLSTRENPPEVGADVGEFLKLMVGFW